MKNEDILTIVTAENLDAYLSDFKKELDAFKPSY